MREYYLAHKWKINVGIGDKERAHYCIMPNYKAAKHYFKDLGFVGYNIYYVGTITDEPQETTPISFPFTD